MSDLAQHLLKTYVVSPAVYREMAKKSVEEIVAAGFPADIMDRLVVSGPAKLPGNRHQRRKMGAGDRKRPKRG